MPKKITKKVSEKAPKKAKDVGEMLEVDEEDVELEMGLDNLEKEEENGTARICMSVKKSLLKKIDEEAESEERSRSGYLSKKLKELFI